MEMLCKRKISKDVKRAMQSIPKLMKSQKTADDVNLNLFKFNLYEIEKQIELSEILEYDLDKFYKNHFADYIFFNTNHLGEDEICFTVRRIKDVQS